MALSVFWCFYCNFRHIHEGRCWKRHSTIRRYNDTHLDQDMTVVICKGNVVTEFCDEFTVQASLNYHGLIDPRVFIYTVIYEDHMIKICTTQLALFSS